MEEIESYKRSISSYIGGSVRIGENIAIVVPSSHEEECYTTLSELMSTFSLGSCHETENGSIKLDFYDPKNAEKFMES